MTIECYTFGMWSLILAINSVILSLISVYFVYSIGAAFLLGEWKQLLFVLLTWLFFVFTEIAIGAINQW